MEIKTHLLIYGVVPTLRELSWLVPYGGPLSMATLITSGAAAATGRLRELGRDLQPHVFIVGEQDGFGFDVRWRWDRGNE